MASDYRVTCFGGDELVLQGWTWDDQGVYDCHVESGMPRWLVCTAEHARLTTIDYEPGDPAVQLIDPANGPLRVAFDPDGAAAATLEPNRWVEVRGRFGDPITDSCDAIVDVALAEECRSAFVASAARVLDSPP